MKQGSEMLQVYIDLRPRRPTANVGYTAFVALHCSSVIPAPPRNLQRTSCQQTGSLPILSAPTSLIHHHVGSLEMAPAAAHSAEHRVCAMPGI